MKNNKSMYMSLLMGAFMGAVLYGEAESAVNRARADESGQTQKEVISTQQGKVNSLWHSLDSSQKDAVVGLYGDNDSSINRARAHESKQGRKDAVHTQEPRKFNLLWHSLTSVQKNAVLRAIEKHKELGADAVSVTVLREYIDNLAQGQAARAVFAYLSELSKSQQRYLLMHEAKLSETQVEKIVDVVKGKPEESSAELMMYDDRDFFNMLD